MMEQDFGFLDGRATPVAQEPVASDIEQMALTRYRPAPDGLLRYKVVSGNGTRALYHGTKDECCIIARKLTEAFLDGAFAAPERPIMPPLTDAMRAVLRNEHCVYDSEDTLYAALCNAAGPAPSDQDREDDEALADTQRAIIEAAERRGYARAEAENVSYRTDAERYRWLKENIELGYELPGGYYIPDEDTDTWDKTIDAARAAKETDRG